MTDQIMRLPAWLRHLIAIFLAVFVVTVATSIVGNGGVQNLPSDVLWSAIDAAALAVASVVVLWVTPFTDAYGVGKGAADFELGGPR